MRLFLTDPTGQKLVLHWTYFRHGPIIADVTTMASEAQSDNGDLSTALAAKHMKDLRVATRTVLTIHNVAHQGVFPKEVLPSLGLSWDDFTVGGAEFYERVLSVDIRFRDTVERLEAMRRPPGAA